MHYYLLTSGEYSDHRINKALVVSPAPLPDGWQRELYGTMGQIIDEVPPGEWWSTWDDVVFATLLEALLPDGAQIVSYDEVSMDCYRMFGDNDYAGQIWYLNEG